MTFEQFAAAVHDWARRFSPKQFRVKVARQLASQEGVEGLSRGISIEAALVMVRMGIGPGMRPVVLDGAAPVPRKGEPSRTAIASESPSKPEAESEAVERVPRRELCGRPSKRAQALGRGQLANGPKPGEQVQAAAEAADIPKRSLIAAADSLGVRTQRGQWWLPPSEADRDTIGYTERQHV